METGRKNGHHRHIPLLYPTFCSTGNVLSFALAAAEFGIAKVKMQIAALTRSALQRDDNYDDDSMGFGFPQRPMKAGNHTVRLHAKLNATRPS